VTLAELTKTMGLDGEPRRVLIVEDFLPVLLSLEHFWKEAGHEVTALTGVTAFEGDIIRGHNPAKRGETELNLREVNAAFLDQNFMGRTMSGTQLTKALVERGMPKVFGMSSDATANGAMVKVGAVGALRKNELMRLFGI